MSDSEESIVRNIIDKKFTKANGQFTDMMRNKVYKAVDDFKKGFKYVTHDKAPEPQQDKTDG
tara:strand:+ start:160 stop:345 length:186 start_codon:yes stop_codon:yes gene_type:complete